VSRLSFWKRKDEVAASQLGKASPVRFGAVFLVILAIVVYFGFTKHIPFKHGFRLKAEFASVLNVRPKSPVRIAGVDVGVVKSIKRDGPVGDVTMEIKNNGLPIHTDATLKIRPRIFLEGNFFVEVQPGSPSAPTVSSGYTIPITQTADPVQLDQVLDALNTDTRTNLQEFLVEFGKAFTQKPTAAENAIQDPEVRGLDGAQAFNKAYRNAPSSLKGTALVQQAFAGSSQDDLAKLVASVAKLTSALDVHENELGEWVDNFNTFLSEFAQQSANLGKTVAVLPGAVSSLHRSFVSLDAAFPSIRSFSKALIPGIKLQPTTFAAAFPWIEQVKASLSPTELGGVAEGLRGGALWTAKLVGSQIPFQKQTTEFSQCLTNAIYPAGNTKIQDGTNTSGVENYKEFWYALTGLAGSGQNFDGNGVTPSFLVGAGGDTFRTTPVSEVGSVKKGLQLVARTPNPPLGTRPAFPAEEPPYKPLVPCSTQAVPNFNGPLSSGPADGGGG
jgi:phospholipid/cholesterol/gamma-HCH transport system substrate-binding protein